MVRFIYLLSALIAFIALSSCEIVLTGITGQSPRIEQVNLTDTATVNGVLGKQFYKKLKKFHAKNPQVKNLVLQDMPGSLNDEWNIKSCRFIHDSCFNTIVTDSSVVASGAVDLFISGNTRTCAPGAKIGVHSWRDLKQDGSEYPRTSDEHILFLDFFDAIEMDTTFYWYTLRAAPGKSIHWMTPEEIEFYRLPKESDSLSNCK